MAQAHTEFEGEFEDEYEDEYEGEGEEFLGALGGLAKTFLGGEGEDELESEFELEDEMEGELESEYEDEFETELESEFEMELEDESESEWEGEDENEDEAFLGALGGLASSLLGEGELEDEYEGEDEAEAEEFFKGIGRFLKKHKNVFRAIAKNVGPLVATAVGGPAAGALARAVTSQLEGELEAELEAELEDMATAPITSAQALGEYFAAQAANAESEAEAEAFAGSAVTLALSRSERRQLQAMLPHLLRGASILTRALHRHPVGRQGVRLVPGIVDATARTLARQSAGGPVSRADVGAVLGRTARRVLSDPGWQSAVTRRHARGLARSRRMRQHQYPGRHAAGHRGHGHGYGYGTRGRGPVRSTIRRTPTRVHTVSGRARVPRPRPGVVRVVTPVRIPPRGGAPARIVRVVSDVKVPRGAVPAGRPVGVAGRRR
ncbi:MAG: hypothetical protein JWR90_611 [Marmoricola sp.]|nr:hypothetical protein [Marmoricola sp.]